MFDGTYAYRFGGFSVHRGVPHHVVGTGTMTMTWDASARRGKVTDGLHVSTATQLTGDAAVLGTKAFKLTGSFVQAPAGGHIWIADIVFTSTDLNDAGTPNQVLDGSFAFVPAGDDSRFWLISTGAKNETAHRKADEVVSGEAVRLTASALS